MPGRRRDLCWTCHCGPRCINRGTADKPVFYCDEFDAYVPVSRVSFENASRIPCDGKEGSDKYQGLCLNCEDRETCTIRDLEGGVWHCEEYR